MQRIRNPRDGFKRIERLAVWLPAPGYDGLYEVSDSGSILSAHTGRVLSAPLSLGYPIVGLWKNGRRKSIRVHRLVALAFLGESPPGKPYVNHINGNRADPRLINLEWASPAENVLHAYHVSKNMSATGARNGRAKLDEASVIEIWSSAKAGASAGLLASRWGVSKTTIRQIITGVRWSNVTVGLS